MLKLPGRISAALSDKTVCMTVRQKCGTFSHACGYFRRNAACSVQRLNAGNECFHRCRSGFPTQLRKVRIRRKEAARTAGRTSRNGSFAGTGARRAERDGCTYFPTQKWEKISFVMSAAVSLPSVSARRESASSRSSPATSCVIPLFSASSARQSASSACDSAAN